MLTTPLPPLLARQILVFQSVLLGGALLMVGLWTAAGAFSEPIVAPPGNNAPAPLNEGSAAQTKQGALRVNDILSANRLVDFDNASAYIDFSGTAKLKGNVSLGGNLITNSANPGSATDLATKDYVDTNAALAGF